MSLIKILPENLANQIAAGEVVERPASVVKELVENSIDAGAGHIAVQIENGGTGLIRVVDDGRGMDEDDMLLSLERHATSKLTHVDQLTTITTLGFRGEAIPSIASVSRMTITSRVAAALLGNRVEIRFGKVVKVHEMGAVSGTVIEVKNLFGNVPARRKFLKSTVTEIAHIDEVVRSYALANYTVGFSLQVNGRTIFDWDADDSEGLRVEKAIGGALGQLTALDSSHAGLYEVRGYLPIPEQGSVKSAKLWLFVNGRSVKDRVIAHAVSEGMQGFLMKGRRAAGSIFLEVPPGQVDVNVHPAKQEVRFRKANLVHNAVVETVRQAMVELQQQRKSELFGTVAHGMSPENSSHPSIVSDRCRIAELPEPATPVQVYEKPSCPAIEVMEPVVSLDKSKPLQPLDCQDGSCARLDPMPMVPGAELVATTGLELQSKATLPLSHAEPDRSQEESRQQDKPLFILPESIVGGVPAGTRYVGQFMDTYLIFEVETGIAVIDQHAAQERLLFEELKHSYESREMASQLLMFPEMIDLTPFELEVLEQNGPEIARLGVDIDHFGGSSFVIKAVPSLMMKLAPLDVFRDLLARFAQGDDGGRTCKIENILASMACKAAIKGGNRLSREEAEELLGQMRDADIFSHCPHGRPVVKIFAPHDIKKWFSRT